MDALLAKLTNLGYEFFGIVLPGVVCWVFVGLWWIALGPVVELWSGGTVPAFRFSELRQIIEGLSASVALAAAVPALTSIYFLGHVLHWLARSGKAIGTSASSARRVCRSLLFRIPKPNDSYNPKLAPMFDAIRKRFVGGDQFEWAQAFPVLKSYLSRNLSYSLVATYQNKYTLHRSVTAGAALWFWLNLGTIPAAIITRASGGPPVHWVLLGACLAAALILVWGFSDSYMFHWQNFGNTIITESYSLLEGPNDENS